MAASTASRSRMSATMKSCCCPWLASSPANAARRASSRRASRVTSAPSAAKARAEAKPMPSEAPQTRALRPSRTAMSVLRPDGLDHLRQQVLVVVALRRFELLEPQAQAVGIVLVHAVERAEVGVHQGGAGDVLAFEGQGLALAVEHEGDAVFGDAQARPDQQVFRPGQPPLCGNDQVLGNIVEFVHAIRP